MCWTDTLVHQIAAEDHAIALVRFESGAMGQIEAGWAFRGGMDLRDEVSGTGGTIRLNHRPRTGFERFTAGGSGGYVAEKSEIARGWLFPVGDEVHELGYVPMFSDMFDAMDRGRAPRENFYNGYVVNAVLDAGYRSAVSNRWEPVVLDVGRPTGVAPRPRVDAHEVDGRVLIKAEQMPDGTTKQSLRDPAAGAITDVTVDACRPASTG